MATDDEISPIYQSICTIPNPPIPDGDLDVNYFDEIFISSEYKLVKPDPKFFQLILDKFNVQKDEVIFTDDKQFIVDGANAFGIHAFQFHSAAQLTKDLRSLRITV